jgi:hypothetical protein
MSFRLDPPAEILPVAPLFPPGPSVLNAHVRPLVGRDLRGLTLLATVALAGALGIRFRGRRRRTLVALALLVAPLAIGTVLGAPVALGLAALVGAWVARDQGRPTATGLLVGAAVALDHRAVLVAPFLLVADGSLPQLRRTLGWAAATYALLTLPVAFLDLPAFVGRAAALEPPGPGLGLVNLLTYRGAESQAAALGYVGPLAALLAALWLLRRPWPPLARAAVASLVGIVLAPSVSADAVAVPLLLLAVAALEGGESTSAAAGGRAGPALVSG